ADGAQQDRRKGRVSVQMTNQATHLEEQARLQALRQGSADLGWVEGRNVRIDMRYTAGHADPFVTAAEELVALKPDVVVAANTLAVQAFRRETQTIPIVFAAVTDPVGQGILQRLARPEGNITGFMTYEA